ncbi:MAG: hypothetical protein JXQ96_16750 [Cyclobacteriaceae bacterium]
MTRILVLLITFIFYAHHVQAQDFLLLSKSGMKKRFKYYEGDEFKFRLKGEKHFNTKQILRLRNDSIFFNASSIAISEISKVDIRSVNKHWFDPDILAQMGIYAGVGYLLVDQFNHTVVRGDGWDVDKGVLKTSAILVTSGILIHKTKRRYFKVNGRNKIKIVTF